MKGTRGNSGELIGTCHRKADGGNSREPRLPGLLLQTIVVSLLGLMVGCRQTPAADLMPPAVPVVASATATPAGPATLAVDTSLPASPTPQPILIALATPTLAATGQPTPVLPEVCGTILPILPPAGDEPISSLTVDPAALARLEAIIPFAARPALDHMLLWPEKVGIAAYQVGQEGNGVFLNEGVPMPLASVVKVLHLIAYTEAVTAGRLDPFQTAWLRDMEAYYQPGLDRGSHERAVAAMEAEGRVFAEPPAVLLEVVPRMMIEHSSNAATDYLHMLLGQEAIEETAVSLGLTSQSAPCPFVGQFLAMANHSRPLASDLSTVRRYLEEPERYGQEVMQLTTSFSSDPAWRREAIRWRQETGRPDGQTQNFFVENLNAHGSPADYAGLMARIAQNGLSNPDSSYLTRLYLEWPMRFEDNQEQFANLGYKNGSLPGVLTTVYYAYRPGDVTPVVVALFFHNLETNTYRNWRNSLPHDELARWLVSDPAAIPALRAVLTP